ncbi:ER membrane protein complex subunit 2-A-like [Diorhabda sublineata]|uniref:ER membrane protein complex subunit 2-A-like n=1 Tax=Diorhabda sublineata TaxID=1163346 RepID=UPI0024E122C5|nr:ER membrane protein complex subunit 2-A-like [Diorhabda sublineata]XP_056632289.1 ER membrane protein complex subunit 2-A-like [Diorhabda sublineata]
MGNFRRDLDLLKKFRDNNDRNSREVVQIWNRSINSNIDKLGKEKHVVLEQVCIAALDSFQLKVAEICIKELYNEFPDSCRVQVLESMLYEADENFERAILILRNVIQQDTTNSSARKRQIAILKSLGRTSDAIRELTDYLKVFMADIEAWQELSELYLSEFDYSKAAFCIEELILHSPHNHLLHQRYADVKYSQGGLENMELARNYYYQSFKLNPKNMRSLYGIYLTTSVMLTAQKVVSGKKKDAAQKVLDWVLKEIKQRYAEKQNISDISESLAALEI